ncbi:hypothetical protein MMPV_004911 [Pyropia vietnamensis]
MSLPPTPSSLGHAVYPRSDCPHLQFAAATAAAATAAAAPGAPPPRAKAAVPSPAAVAAGAASVLASSCAGCGVGAGENWVCLSCGTVRCSRYVSGCMAVHATAVGGEGGCCGCGGVSGGGGDGGGGGGAALSTGAAVVATSAADLSTWCFGCDDYVTGGGGGLDVALDALHCAKFGTPRGAVVMDLRCGATAAKDPATVLFDIVTAAELAATTAAAGSGNGDCDGGGHSSGGESAAATITPDAEHPREEGEGAPPA